MPTRPESLQALKDDLKVLVIEIGALDITPDEMLDEEQLIAGRYDLNSLDAIEIASAVDYAYEVRIEDVRGAREVMRSIDSLALHIANECGWDL